MSLSLVIPINRACELGTSSGELLWRCRKRRYRKQSAFLLGFLTWIDNPIERATSFLPSKIIAVESQLSLLDSIDAHAIPNSRTG